MSNSASNRFEAAPTRFEYLCGRFFDGMLTADEDRELSELLEDNSQLAKQFVNQVIVERVAIGSAASRRVDDGSFSAAVMRSLELLDDETESQHFADEVIQLVQARASRRSHARISIIRRRNEREKAIPISIIGVCAAMLLLALLLAFSRPVSQPADTTAEKVRVEPVDLKRKNQIDNEELAARRPQAEPKVQPVPRDTNTVTPPTIEIAEPVIEKPLPALPPKAVATVPESTPAPKPLPKIPAAALATVTTLSNAKLIRVASGTNAEQKVKAGDVLYEGDNIRVPLPDSSPSEGTADSAVEISLKDGSVLKLQQGTTLTLHAEDSAQRPILETGELTAHIKKQTQKPLVISTRQGAEAAVLGTVFKLSADTQNKRVILRVEEGKVQFSNNGEKTLVTADQIAIAEDGKAPSAAFYSRPRPASITGMVLDKETGKPIVNTFVVVAPVAERKVPAGHLGTKTDAEGKFSIENIPEGNVFLFAKSDESGSVGVLGRATTPRVKLNSGEKLTLNLNVDKGILCTGRVTENGKPLTDYNVRLIPPNGDGCIFKLELSQKPPPNEYRTISFDGPGRYTAIVEKAGMIARIKGAHTNELRLDRVTTWNMDVQLSPSATLKGRITQASSGVVIPDSANANDPRQPHSVVTLTMPNGMVQVVLAEADGSFCFDTNLDSGQYEIKVERLGFGPSIKRVNLVAGQKLELDMPLDLPKPPNKIKAP